MLVIGTVHASGEVTDPHASGLYGELLQGHLKQLAARLPGMACDGFGTVFEVLDGKALPAGPLSDRIDLIVRFDARGYFEEVHIAQSSGDADLDFDVADYLCTSAKVTERTLPGWHEAGGWARMSIRLRG